VSVRDKQESATFLAEMLGVSPPTRYGPFLVVQVDDAVSLDFADDHGPAHPQHSAFLVSEVELDQRSTPMMAAAASLGRSRAAISWRSSLAPMAAEADSPSQHQRQPADCSPKR
jgi:hypothetical protein